MFGDDEGVAAEVAALGAIHVPGVATTDLGTPRIDDVLRQASGLATTSQICFVNTDIVISSDLEVVADRVGAWADEYLVIGRRWNLDLRLPLSFHDDWDTELLDRVKREAFLSPEYFLDYFLYPRGRYVDLPPLAVGLICGGVMRYASGDVEDGDWADGAFVAGESTAEEDPAEEPATE